MKKTNIEKEKKFFGFAKENNSSGLKAENNSLPIRIQNFTSSFERTCCFQILSAPRYKSPKNDFLF